MAAEDLVEGPKEGQSDMQDKRRKRGHGRELDTGQLATDNAL